MSTLNDLFDRRSIRSYTAQEVEQEKIDAIVKAGSYAPSAMGKQPSKVVVVKNKALRDELSQLNAAVMNGKNDPFYGAPVVITVFTDTSTPTYKEDGSLVMGNMLNAAYALGLGSCWINRAYEVFQTPRGKELMQQWGIPETYVGIGNVIIGYTEQKPVAKPRREDFVVTIE